MGQIEIDRPYPKQVEFFTATNRYIAYGGARGGGKSWSARVKAVFLALNYPGIQILLLRRTLIELRENHVVPLRKLLKTEQEDRIAIYKEQSKEFLFDNTSRIVLGYCANENDVLQYQGQAYDVIFLEEATQFTEFQFQALTESNRSSGLCKVKFSPRMYFTANPGGVGHAWFKRLFIDRDYRNQERPEDYKFIQALVYDNEYLMQNDPDYVRTLENLPEDRRKAMLYGDWDSFEGQYFTEFDRNLHVIEPFEIPEHWRRYLAMDYGLDMLAVLWIAIDTQGKAYVYKELHKSNLIISEAVEEIKRVNGKDKYDCIFAPRDLWNRRQDTGKSVADIFAMNNMPIVQTSVERVHGWLATKEWLHPYEREDEQTGELIKDSSLKIFSNCFNLIKNLPQLLIDDKDPNDASTEPHEITHICDAMRYFCVNFTSRAKEKNRIDTRYYMPSEIEDYIDRKEVRKPTNRINRR